MLSLWRSTSAKLRLSLLSRLRTKPKNALPPYKTEGSVLPLVVFTILVVTVGAAALMARGASSWLSSVSNSDYQAAKEAAETGFNRILAQLNTNERSHFLVTKFGRWYASPPTLSQAASCNVFMPSVVSAPSNAKTELASGVGQFFQLTSYSAPARSPGSPEGIGGVSCDMFGNLFGGSAEVQVLGTVERGGVTRARFRLSKIIYVKGPFTESSQPPFTPLLITGPAGSTLGKFDQGGGKGLARTGNPADPKNDPTTTAADAACLQVANCISDNTKVGDIDATTVTLPSFPTLASQGDTRTTGASSQESADATLSYGTSYTNTMFPYVNADGTPASNNTSNYLAPGCYFNNRTAALDRVNNSGSSRPLQSSNSTANGSPASTAINCVVGTISNPNILVDTSRLPVNIFVRGTGISAVAVTPGNSSTIRLNNRTISNWQNLRIYGVNTGTSTDCGQQTVTVNASPFDGAYVWMPNATFRFSGSGTGGGQEGSYGVRWVCRFEGPGSGDRALFGPVATSSTAGFNSIFPGFFNTSTNDTFNPSPIPSAMTNYRAYGVTY